MSEAHHADEGKSERYELEDIFPGEAPENLHFLSVAGQVVLVGLLVLALVFAFSKLGTSREAALPAGPTSQNPQAEPVW